MAPRSGPLRASPRAPAMMRSMTAQARVRQLVSPGNRPITLVRRRTSSSERSSRFVERRRLRRARGRIGRLRYDLALPAPTPSAFATERSAAPATRSKIRLYLAPTGRKSGFSTPTGQGCPSGDEHGSGLEFTALEPTKSPGGVLERELFDDRVD